MKCSYCYETAELSCIYQFHLRADLKNKENHLSENPNENLSKLRLSRLRSKLIKIIQKVKIGKNELASKSKLLFESIQRAFKLASSQLDAIIKSYSELLVQFKF